MIQFAHSYVYDSMVFKNTTNNHSTLHWWCVGDIIPLSITHPSPNFPRRHYPPLPHTHTLFDNWHFSYNYVSCQICRCTAAEHYYLTVRSLSFTNSTSFQVFRSTHFYWSAAAGRWLQVLPCRPGHPSTDCGSAAEQPSSYNSPVIPSTF